MPLSPPSPILLDERWRPMGIVKGLGNSALRWVLVLCGAAVGSYGGRIAAAKLRGEPVKPLLRLDRALVLRPDVVPGFLAVEFIGKVLRLGPWSAALVAAAAAAAAAIAEGPVVSEKQDEQTLDDGTGELGPVV
jgi:hypothetical protein